MTGMETAPMMPWTMSGSLIRAMPPWARMSAGTRSRAMTATAPASSAIRACSGVTTSMMTPPFSCSAMPRLTASVPVVPGTVVLCSATGTASVSDVGRGLRCYGRARPPPAALPVTSRRSSSMSKNRGSGREACSRSRLGSRRVRSAAVSRTASL
jgi:hypothetical protein